MPRDRLEIAVTGILKYKVISFDTNNLVKQKPLNLTHEKDYPSRG